MILLDIWLQYLVQVFSWVIIGIKWQTIPQPPPQDLEIIDYNDNTNFSQIINTLSLNHAPVFVFAGVVEDDAAWRRRMERRRGRTAAAVAPATHHPTSITHVVSSHTCSEWVTSVMNALLYKSNQIKSNIFYYDHFKSYKTHKSYTKLQIIRYKK